MSTGTGESKISELHVRPGLLDTVRYAAAMWEFQRLHFDHDWARHEGLDAAVVQGPLLGNYLARMVMAAVPAGLDLAALAWRNLAVVRVDEQLRCGGDLSAPFADGSRTANLWIRNVTGATVVSGSARFRPGGRERRDSR